MNIRSQLNPASTRSTFPVRYEKQATMTLDEYLDKMADDYRRATPCNELASVRTARIAMCREFQRTLGLRLLYRQACAMIPCTC
jgi:hypothetical protein